MLESFASALLVASLLTVPSQSSTSGGRWESDYGRALAKTRSAQKPLLIILDNPRDAEHRIEPVRLLKEQSADTHSAALLEPYELCHVDASTEYGRRVAQVFKAQTLPYMAIIDKTGRKIIYRDSGRITEGEWQTALTTHASGEITRVVPAGYSLLNQQQGFYDPSYCPSCQVRW